MEAGAPCPLNQIRVEIYSNHGYQVERKCVYVKNKSCHWDISLDYWIQRLDLDLKFQNSDSVRASLAR